MAGVKLISLGGSFRLSARSRSADRRGCGLPECVTDLLPGIERTGCDSVVARIHATDGSGRQRDECRAETGADEEEAGQEGADVSAPAGVISARTSRPEPASSGPATSTTAIAAATGSEASPDCSAV